MNETFVTLVGNVATAVEHRHTANGVPTARFRLATRARRYDRGRDAWGDGATSFYTVRAWRGLADNLAASVSLGEPLVVHGRLTLREGEQSPERGGQRWFSAEVDALTVGHDMARGTCAFRRSAPARTESGAPPAAERDPWATPEPPPMTPSSAPNPSDAVPSDAVPSDAVPGDAGPGEAPSPDAVAAGPASVGEEKREAPGAGTRQRATAGRG